MIGSVLIYFFNGISTPYGLFNAEIIYILQRISC